MAESGLQTVDMSAGVSHVLSVKDSAEVMNVKKASLLAAKVRPWRRGGISVLVLSRVEPMHLRRLLA